MQSNRYNLVTYGTMFSEKYTSLKKILMIILSAIRGEWAMTVHMECNVNLVNVNSFV